MSDKERQTILERTSFKNVSGNWQFRGDMTPERFLRIAEDVTSERPKAWNEAIDACINIVFQEDGDFQQFISPKVVLEQLEALKHKQP